MNGPEIKLSSARRKWLRQGGMCGVLALLTGIVTVLFSYVGTLCLAVLAGMMLGTLPRSGWVAVRAAVVFPLVMVAMLQVWRVDVELSRQLMMAGLSLAMFWGVYFLTLLMISLEAKPAAPGERLEAESESSGMDAVSGSAQRAVSLAAGHVESVDFAEASRVGSLSLAALEGQWRCEMVHPGGRSVQKTLRVVGDRFHMDILPPDGGSPLAFDGWLRLGGAGFGQTMTLLAADVGRVTGCVRSIKAGELSDGDC